MWHGIHIFYNNTIHVYALKEDRHFWLISNNLHKQGASYTFSQVIHKVDIMQL